MLGRNIDLKNSLKIARSISPQSVAAAATVNGTGVNCTQTGPEVLAVISVGAVASGGTAVVKLQSSLNDNTGTARDAADAYADITGATVNLSGTDANTLVYIQTFVRVEGYVRATVTVAVDAIILGVDLICDKDVL